MAKRKYNLEDIKLLVPDYIMGRLNPDDKQIVENAVENSPELKSLFDEMKITLGFVGTVKFKDPEPQYWAALLPKIHGRIEKSEEKRFSWVGIASYLPAKALAQAGWKYALPAAAVILIALLYFTLFYKQPDAAFTKKENEQIKTDNNNDLKKNEDVKREVVKEDETKEPDKNKEKVIEVQKRKEYKIEENQLTKIKQDEFEKKEEIEKKDDRDDLTAENLEEEAVFSGGAGGFDEDVENELNRLSSNEKEILINELINSNL